MNVLVNEETMTDIADAIRTKTGKQDLMLPAEMPEEIMSISGGGTPAPEPVPEKDVRFYDYDGTLVYSYTLEELEGLTSMPDPPVHPGLISEGWNWTLEELKAQNSIMDVGAVYITDDGSTRVHIRIFEERKDPELYYRQDTENGSIIDWGDGSEPEIASPLSVSITHEYQAAGSYVISITPVDNCKVTITGDSIDGTYILINAYASASRCKGFQGAIRKVELGRNVILTSYAFSNAFALETVTIPKEIESVGTYAFNNCHSIKCLVIPVRDSVVSNIANIMNGLEVLCLPELIQTIPNQLVNGCSSLKRVCFPDTVAVFGTSVIYNGKLVEEVHVPVALTEINKYFVKGCLFLRKINIPSGLITILDGAFDSTSAMSGFHLPASVTAINGNAFSGSGFKDLYIEAETPPTIFQTTFKNIPSNAKIHVPHGCLQRYLAAQYWSTLSAYLVEMDA